MRYPTRLVIAFLSAFIGWIWFGVSQYTNAADSNLPLIGQWKFDAQEPLSDSTGLWSPLTLHEQATTSNGRLQLHAVSHPQYHSISTGWANAVQYRGPAITDKTLVSWVELKNPSITAGSVISIDSIDATDIFDGIVWGELVAGRWMAGSNYYSRSQAMVMEDEPATGVVQIAISYKIKAERVQVTLCRGTKQLASYEDAPAATWNPGNAEVVFGQRHTSQVVGLVGGLEGDILEARIYGAALDCAGVGSLSMAP